MKLAKVAVFLACLAPAVFLAVALLRDELGGNPVEAITHSTGDWALRFLLITLAITPLRKTLRRPELIRFRRMLGLWAFFYAVMHFLIWLWLDKEFAPGELLADIRKRPFITAGAVGLLAMVPLALTSTAGWIRRLGGRRWQALHRLTYLAAAAGVVHYYWLVKSDVRLPLLYGAIFLLLMLWRLYARWSQRPSRGGAAATAS